MNLKTISFVLFFFAATLARGSEVSWAYDDPALAEKAWYVDRIHLKQAWSIVDTTLNTPVAVIDSDFDVNHPELVSAFDLSIGKNFLPTFIGQQEKDWISHGTAVAGLIGADGFNNYGFSGVSKKARLIPIPFGDGGATEDLFKLALKSNAKIINGSFMVFFGTEKKAEDIKAIFQQLLERDILVVLAAGNFGALLDESHVALAQFSAKFPNVITVGASDQQDKITTFSNYSRTYVDLFAPGKDILVVSSYGMRYSDGTSEAAPLVSGVAALMREVNPALSAAQIKDLIVRTSDKIPGLEKVSRSGGRLNAEKAVRAAKALKK